MLPLIKYPDGSRNPYYGKPVLPLNLTDSVGNSQRFNVPYYSINSVNHDIILGRSWLFHANSEMDFTRQYWRYRDKSSIKVDIKHPTRFAKLARNQTVYFLSVNLIKTETSELIDILE